MEVLMRLRRLIVLSVFGSAGFLPIAPAAHAMAPTVTHLTVTHLTVTQTAEELTIEDQILGLVNASRADAGLAPMVRNPVLDGAADEWNAHMIAGLCPASRNFPLCHHSRAELSALAKAATAPNGLRWWAENVQTTWGRAEKSHTNFMNSTGHRANIMRPTTNQIGIGVTITPSGVMFVTQEFVEAKAPPVVNPCGKVFSTLRPGSKGKAVKVLQCALTDAGVYSGTQTGIFDQPTKTAVKLYQSTHGLRVNGWADLATRASLHLR
jgi:uncharacterized protein YkwD